MDITIHQAYLPLRWITVGPAEQPGTSIVLADGTHAAINLATKDLDG